MSTKIPSHFVQMDQTHRKNLLKGHKDALTSLAIEQHKKLETIPCPNCGMSGAIPQLDTKRPFGYPIANIEKGAELQYTPGNVGTAKMLLLCSNCSTLFDPETRLVLTQGRMPRDAQQVSKTFLWNVSTKDG